MTEKNKMLDRILSILEKAVGGTEVTIPVIKQFQEEEMVAIEYLYPVDQDDAHGDRMDRDEIRKMVDNLNGALQKGKVSTMVDHAFVTEGWKIEKAWVNECDCYIGDTLVPEGWPLVKTRFTNKDLWQARKDGKLMGLSIGAKGIREEVQ